VTLGAFQPHAAEDAQVLRHDLLMNRAPRSRSAFTCRR
jgi:hypothetical protein